MHTNSTNGSVKTSKPQQTNLQQQKPQTSQTSRKPAAQSQSTSFQAYVAEKQQAKAATTQNLTQRGLNDSTAKFMISKILNGDLENMATNSTNSTKVITTQLNTTNNNNVNGTKSSLNLAATEKPNKVSSFVYFCLTLYFPQFLATFCLTS